MTETFLTILPPLIVSITGFVAIFIRQEKTRKEITNSHPTHLRDDMDDKHNEILEQKYRFFYSSRYSSLFKINLR